jgi:hypothetical protein
VRPFLHNDDRALRDRCIIAGTTLEAVLESLGVFLRAGAGATNS